MSNIQQSLSILLYTAHHGELLKLGIDIGQTSVTTYMGYRAIQNGFETLCTTAAKLIEDLSNASAKGQLQASLLTYTDRTFCSATKLGTCPMAQMLPTSCST